MARIQQWGVEVDVDVDVDIIEILDECSSSEIKEVIDWLVDNDYIKSERTTKSESLMEEEWNDVINKLHTLRQRLTIEEEQIIKSIINKY